ncbi:ABC transporter ATP-binding protein [Pseudoflavonifractor phocaeensis]|uniref:ATP-binding cassette domain-containing protein n=1 Tax=Pseudoflavonifractor phocaeensis TaxID=1870988 RepID=UPI00195E80C1|nr:ABC transporter ATP-binding protein [Pseudoflavonifractor phocaeensis]MBM6938386.1 ABC transporter ATP-binding protein [Pseudoflavonifractor phocaeensis]
MEPILTVSHLQKYYGSRGSVTRAIDDLSLSVRAGEFVGIMGASGSGKTTLLNCVATIDRPTAGTITIGGQVVTALRPAALSRFRREKLGFIFQDCNLLDTLTAFENIALPLSIQNRPAGEIGEKVRRCARLLEIEDCMEKYPYQMSGGQCQRTAAARAIVTDPALVLADEPTGALDSKAARLLLDRFEALNRDRSATILMVTHDAFTASYCHRILFIKDGRAFTELVRGEDSRKAFFTRIIEVVTLLGGDSGDVL